VSFKQLLAITTGGYIKVRLSREAA